MPKPNNNSKLENKKQDENDSSPLGDVPLRVTAIALGVLFVSGLFLYSYSYLSAPPAQFSVTPEKQIQCCSEQDKSLETVEGGEDSMAANKKQTRQEKNAQLEEAQRTDLAAQRGMWRATNIVALVAFGQAIATFIGLLWIYQTLLATRKTLEQTLKATDLAGDTLKETQRANFAQLKPYLKLTYDDYEIINNRINKDGSITVSMMLNIANKGTTPAENIECYTAEGRLHFKSLNGWERATYKFPVSNNSAIALLSSAECLKVEIRSNCQFIDGHGQAHTMGDGKTINPDWVLDCINISEIRIHYKDIESHSTDWHKVARGRVTYRRDSIIRDEYWSTTRIYSVDPLDDEKHESYKQMFAKPEHNH